MQAANRVVALPVQHMLCSEESMRAGCVQAQPVSRPARQLWDAGGHPHNNTWPHGLLTPRLSMACKVSRWSLGLRPCQAHVPDPAAEASSDTYTRSCGRLSRIRAASTCLQQLGALESSPPVLDQAQAPAPSNGLDVSWGGGRQLPHRGGGCRCWRCTQMT